MFVLSMVIAAGAWWITKTNVEKISRERFESRVNEVESAIRQRLMAYEQILNGCVGLFDASEEVTRDELRVYVKNLNIEKHYPGIQGIGFAELILPTQKNDHIERVRAEGFPDYDIKPEGERPEYTSIVYIEPFSGRNLRAFGYDMFSEPLRRLAMEQARDTALTAISGKVKLLQEADRDVQAGFLMYFPVYRHGQSHETVEERRENLLGYVYSPFRVNDLMRGILGDGKPEVALEIFDGNQVSEKSRMFGNNMSYGQNVDFYLTATETLEINDHRWTLRFSSLPAFEAGIGKEKPRIVFTIGTIISLLIFAISWSMATQSERALATARRLDKFNDELQAEIAERERVEHELRVSEELRNKVIESSLDCMKVLDLDARLVWMSEGGQKLMEVCDLGTLINANWLEFWKDEHREAVIAAVEAAKAGGVGKFIGFCPTMEGTPKWWDVIIVPILDEQGKPFRLLSVSRDITEQRLAEENLRKAKDELEIKVAERTAELSRANKQLQDEIADRKRAEEVLRESEERFRSAFDYASIGMALVSLEGRWLKVSPSLCKIVGYSEQELLATDFQTITHPDDLEADLAFARQLLAGEIDTYQMEKRYFHKRGHVIWILLNASLVRDFSGNPLYFIAQIQDITLNKQVDEALQENLIQLSKKTRYETIISAVTQSVHKSIDLQEVMENAVNAMSANLDRADMVAIYQVEGQDAVLITSKGFNDQYIRKAGRISCPKGFTWNTITEGKARYCPDVEKDTVIGPAGRDAGIKSYLSMPIHFDGKTIGCININSIVIDAYDEQDLKLLEIVAQQIESAISNAKRAEALRQSEERYRNLFENVPTGIYRTTPDGRFLMANPALTGMLGYSSFEDLSKRDLNANPQRKEFIEIIEREGKIKAWENSCVRSDGCKIFLRDNAAVFRGDDGNVLYYEGTVEDITEKKLAEQALDETLSQLDKKSRYETIINSVSRSVHQSIDLQDVLENAVESMSENIDGVDNIFISLVEGTEAVLKAHRGYEDWFIERVRRIPYPKGATWKTIIEGKTSYCADTENDNVLGPAGKEVGTKSYVSMPIRLADKTVGAMNINSLKKNAFDEGEIKLIEIVVQQIETAIKNAKQMESLQESKEELSLKTKQLALSNVELSKEIINRTKIEEKLEEQNNRLEEAYSKLEQQSMQLIQKEKMSSVGTMAAGVAHEMNNPMMGILNFIQYCLKHTSDNDRRYKVLQDAEREAKRCIGIVKNLLTFSHMEREGPEEMKKENFSEVIDRVLRLLSYRIKSQGVSITQNVAEGTPEVWMRVNNIQQMLLNLVVNALDAMANKQKKEVNIDVKPDGDFLAVTIEDTGAGISPDIQGKIFDPFFTTKPTGEGTGLGLPVCRNIVDDHGGQIIFESKVGVGTKFKILLPLETREQRRAQNA